MHKLLLGKNRNDDSYTIILKNMKPIDLTDETITSFIEENEKVLIDFHAPWCGPCRAMSSTIDEIAENFPTVAVGKCNVDENEKAAEMFGVLNLPFIALIEKGELVATAVGLQTKENLDKMLNA